ncbi:phage integrase family protein [Nostoc sp. NIES-4103]|nr:phage integrase family protein [Nostoc sp. NIES-4103]
MKINRCGQASVFAPGHLETILSNMHGQNHKMMLRLSYWSAGRAGEVCQIRTSDIYDTKGKPLKKLTYQAAITKTKETRQVPIHRTLKEWLINYWEVGCPDIRGYMFPGAGLNPIQQQSYDDAFRRAVTKADLNSCGYSTHSPRRSILTEMAKRGYALSVIQKFSGHESLESLQKYIDIEEDDLELAISNF